VSPDRVYEGKVEVRKERESSRLDGHVAVVALSVWIKCVYVCVCARVHALLWTCLQMREWCTSERRNESTKERLSQRIKAKEEMKSRLELNHNHAVAYG